MNKKLLFKRIVRSKFFMIGGIMTLIIVILCLFPSIVCDYNAIDCDWENMLIAPEWFARGRAGHILGTDSLGRDILARVLYGGRMSLLIAFAAVGISAVVGTLLGVIAGFYGGWAETLIMRFGDVQLSIPAMMLAIAMVAIVGPNVTNLILILAITGWPGFARIIRSNVMSIKGSEFVSASRVLGASDMSVMFKQVFPNVFTPLTVYSSQQLGHRILMDASLSYLGLGVQPPTPSWGVMISDSRAYLQSNPWLVLVPGITLALTVLAFNFLGDGIRDILDPKMK